MSPNVLRAALAVLVTLVLGGAILGVGLGEDDGAGGSTAARPSGADDAVRVLGAVGERGEVVFKAEGCSGCHTLADAGSTGRIGPNLDDAIADDDAEEIRRYVIDPGPGMPDRYGDLPKADLDALVRYLEAATPAGR
jgi:cytochrome c oxidase subunit 2